MPHPKTIANTGLLLVNRVVEVGLVGEGWAEIPEGIDVCVSQVVGLARVVRLSIVVYRKLPSSIDKHRPGFGLQCAVVRSDLRAVLGKARFKESGGATRHAASAWMPGFAVSPKFSWPSCLAVGYPCLNRRRQQALWIA